jgi:hypothetical protein
MAQISSTTYTIKAGNDAAQTLSKNMYMFPEFVEGKVIFRNGALATSKLN